MLCRVHEFSSQETNTKSSRLPWSYQHPRTCPPDQAATEGQPGHFVQIFNLDTKEKSLGDDWFDGEKTINTLESQKKTDPVCMFFWSNFIHVLLIRLSCFGVHVTCVIDSDWGWESTSVRSRLPFGAGWPQGCWPWFALRTTPCEAQDWIIAPNKQQELAMTCIISYIYNYSW